MTTAIEAFRSERLIRTIPNFIEIECVLNGLNQWIWINIHHIYILKSTEVNYTQIQVGKHYFFSTFKLETITQAIQKASLGISWDDKN